MITQLTYNRSTRTWQLLGEIGELLGEWPAGPNGRHAAIVEQLRVEVPDVQQLALDIEKHCPRLGGRAIRGAQLVMWDCVIAGGRPNRWRVKSPHSRDAFTVHQLDPRLAAWRWHCNCPDWVHGESGSGAGAPWVKHGEWRSPTCKHILAIMLLEETAHAWPPACPECLGPMNVRRQQDNGSGFPFWSCRNFPHCRGRRDFTVHPDDRKAARNGAHARSLSLERATRDGLLQVSASAQRRARRRRLDRITEDYKRAIANGDDPATAAEAADAGIMDFDEWRQHHRAQV